MDREACVLHSMGSQSQTWLGDWTELKLNISNHVKELLMNLMHFWQKKINIWLFAVFPLPLISQGKFFLSKGSSGAFKRVLGCWVRGKDLIDLLEKLESGLRKKVRFWRWEEALERQKAGMCWLEERVWEVYKKEEKKMNWVSCCVVATQAF